MVETMRESKNKYGNPVRFTISFKYINLAYPVIVISILELTGFNSILFRINGYSQNTGTS